MTTFDIDNTIKTKHCEVLESLFEHGHSLQALHNPQTWKLSALTFALHLHDCVNLFKDVKNDGVMNYPFPRHGTLTYLSGKIKYGHWLMMLIVLPKTATLTLGLNYVSLIMSRL